MPAKVAPPMKGKIFFVDFLKNSRRDMSFLNPCFIFSFIKTKVLRNLEIKSNL